MLTTDECKKLVEELEYVYDALWQHRAEEWLSAIITKLKERIHLAEIMTNDD